jgi:WD40 repeat protein
MTETALTLGVHGAGGDAKPVFLCHNSKDKNTVKQIADMLELEFGLPFFIDAYAIPTGEAFLPWIERSLAEASGVAIFLGAHGWGATHLWEAEKALARYATEPTFKLIPVALPGITDADIQRLGSGKFFQEINWADFRQGANDRNSLEKLKAALTGEQLPQYRGPAQLTPYQIRRDAQRWTNEKRNSSILYKGTQLAEADAIVRNNPDFVVASEVMPFLTAAHEHHRRFWKRVAVGSIATVAVLLGLAVAAFVGYRLADERRVASLSRQLAIASREAPGADRQLLTAVQAVLADPTSDARGALLERLETFRYLRRLAHLPRPVETIAVDRASGNILAGTESGRILSMSATATAMTDLLEAKRERAVTAIVKNGVTLWLARANGQVEAVSNEGERKTLLQPKTDIPENRDPAIRMLAAQKEGSWIAAGSQSGRLAVFAPDGKVCLDEDEGPETRITALAFDSRGRWLAAGLNDTVLFVDLGTCKAGPRYPRVGGDVLALGFTENGDLLLVSSGGRIQTLGERDGDFPRSVAVRELGGGWASAAINARGNRIAVGDPSGTVFLYDSIGSPSGFGSVRMHGNPVTALSFAADQETLVSASRDGVLAIWDLTGLSGLSQVLPSGLTSASELRVAPGSQLTAASTILGGAGVWRLAADQWQERLKFEDATRALLGLDALTDADGTTPPAPGFVSLDEEIPALALDRVGNRVAWSTRKGALLWHALDGDAKPKVLSEGDGKAHAALAMSLDGRWLATLSLDEPAVSVIDLSGSSTPMPVKLPDTGRSVAFDEQGERIAVGLEDGQIMLFRNKSGKLEPSGSAQVQDAGIVGLRFTPGNQHLLTFGSGGGAADRTVAVTPLDNLAASRRLHSRQVEGSMSAVAVGAGLLAVGGQDGNILLWSLTDFRFVTTLKAGVSVVLALAIDEPAKRMISYSADGSMLSWDLDTTHWLRLACKKANRTLSEDEWQDLLPDDRYAPACAKPSSPRR